MFRFEFYGKAEYDLRWAWFFGLLSRDIKLGRLKTEKPQVRRKFELLRLREESAEPVKFCR